METTEAEFPNIVKSELLEEMNEEQGFDDTTYKESKTFMNVNLFNFLFNTTDKKSMYLTISEDMLNIKKKWYFSKKMFLSIKFNTYIILN